MTRTWRVYDRVQPGRSLLSGLFAICLVCGLAASAAAANASFETAFAQGQAAFQRGDFATAVTSWQQAAAAAGNNARDVAAARLQLAQVYQRLGQHGNAVAVLQDLSVAYGNTDSAEAALVAALLGHSYSQIGLAAEAEQVLEGSIATARRSGRNDVAAIALNNLGNHLAGAGRPADALARYRESIALARQTDNALLQAKASANAARVALEARRVDGVTTLMDDAYQASRRLDDSHDKAYLLLNLGQLARDLSGHGGQTDAVWQRRSYDYHDAGRQVATAIADQRASAYAYGYLGQLYEDARRFDDALRLTSQAEFAAQQAAAPDVLYAWQWQTGRILSAQGDLDGAIAAYRRAVYTLQSIRADLSLGYGPGRSSFREAVGPVYFGLADLLLRRPRTLTDPVQAKRYLFEARETIEQLKAAELQDYFQDDCVAALQEKITGLDRLAGDTAVIYPILLPDRTELLLSLADGIWQFVVPVDNATITAEIRNFRSRLEKRTTHQYMPHAQQLYRWLIAPVESALKANNITTLVVVPDGALRTIPFTALHDGQDFLVSRYAIATTPGLTLTDPQPLRRDDIELLMNGLTQAVQGFPALPNVARELDAIQDIYGGTLLKDREYVLQSVEQALTKTPYRVVHIASHGQFSSDPKKTFLLTYDDKLTMDRLEQYMGLSKFREEPVELLTLSACQTAAGDDRAALGLAGVAIKAGARSALATLWFINDQASSELVSEFYRQLKDTQISKARALQKAQTSLIADRRYRHPGYWAPFLLIGNWL